MKSARRNIKTLYEDLNNPIRSRDRNPLPPPPKSARTISTTSRTARPSFNPKNFHQVENSTVSVENVIITSRKDKEDQVQAFIDEFHPPPIQILQKIAQVSKNHKSVLLKIINELKQYKEENLHEPVADLSNDAITKITSLRLKTIDMDREIDESRNLNTILYEELEDAKKKLEKAQQEYNRIKTVYDASSFTIYDSTRNEKEIQKELDALPKKPSQKETMKYNALWGENKHLKSEIQKTLDKLGEERQYQLSVIAKRAIKEIQLEDENNEKS
ncbi:hypothetical protein TVAG_392400 [Trichomonas vaginalis G3]|uniref:Uncharacterized protein n=1 Tax=Trichomonas vaginalis (strain ATCC PRA-98 / G3) TaxID=412133 RepID=A2DWU1_TRIV3|nr:hypothetical protein TVAGG3_0839470 [Trichomonas vaginalis G3]EAY15123.1 hypothetical protein TVAG_392400 [Trichomonas vaginalis G3]KAI5499185.1 hypothetical protein TVAGG3_0839470 [Trichomonas vaginalis G3]|eukprot:XP_001327346.1 hypothetical protein [Trichomonas vaginalis G3]